MNTPTPRSLIVIEPKAKRRFTREVAALEKAAADGNTWGPERDSAILKQILIDGARINEIDRALIIDCVQDMREDLAYRLKTFPQDYDEPKAVERRLAAMDRLLDRL